LGMDKVDEAARHPHVLRIAWDNREWHY
jgi:hypothetical protein